MFIEPGAGIAIVYHMSVTESVDKTEAWEEDDNLWASTSGIAAGTVVSTCLLDLIILTDHLSIGYGGSTDVFAGFPCGESSWC